MTISDLNGDSTVSDVCFKNGCIECQYRDGDTGENYDISIPTQRFFSYAASEFESVHIRIIDLKDKLPIDPKSLIFCAPQDFVKQMQATREGFLLAVGLSSCEWPLFLQIRGYELLIACPIQSEESVRVEARLSLNEDDN